MATLVLMPVAGLVTGRLIQPKWLIMVALAGTGWSLWMSSGLDLDIAFWNLSMVRVTQVVWLPFVFIPLSAVSYVGVPPDRTDEAPAIINLMRNLGGSVGVSFTTTMLQERLQFHHERLAEHVTAYNGYGWNFPLPSIDSAVQAQAGIMSYLDIFWVLGLLGLATGRSRSFCRGCQNVWGWPIREGWGVWHSGTESRSACHCRIARRMRSMRRR
jgi:DHA2 family multidrug resistance protein